VEQKKKRRFASASHIRPVSFLGGIASSACIKPNSGGIVAPQQGQAVVEVGPLSLRIKAGATAYVIRNGSENAILCLYESKSGDVVMSVAGKDIPLRTGEQANFGNSQQTAPLLAQVATRGAVGHALSDGFLTLSEFSIPSAITGISKIGELKVRVTR
jgi:hypothetical protein